MLSHLEDEWTVCFSSSVLTSISSLSFCLKSMGCAPLTSTSSVKRWQVRRPFWFSLPPWDFQSFSCNGATAFRKDWQDTCAFTPNQPLIRIIVFQIICKVGLELVFALGKGPFVIFLALLTSLHAVAHFPALISTLATASLTRWPRLHHDHHRCLVHWKSRHLGRGSRFERYFESTRPYSFVSWDPLKKKWIKEVVNREIAQASRWSASPLSRCWMLRQCVQPQMRRGKMPGCKTLLRSSFQFRGSAAWGTGWNWQLSKT